jgi:hypothetical protein
MAKLRNCYPSTALTKDSKSESTSKKINKKHKKRTEKRDHRLKDPRRTSIFRSLGRELPDVSSRQEVHHRLVALLHGKQLRDLHMPASARFPACRLPHSFPERILLLFPPAAEAE